MNIRWKESGTNSKLGVLAIVLGFLSLFAGESRKGNGMPIDPKELARRVQNELDHVTATELASWIMQRRTDFRLIDLRDATAFKEYHIPGAQNILLPSLVESHFDKNQSIVLYSEGGVHSAQAMFLLWAEGYDKVYMLKGGLNEWKDDVLYPQLSGSGASGIASDSIEARQRMSRFFRSKSELASPKADQQPKFNKEREKMRDEC